MRSDELYSNDLQVTEDPGERDVEEAREWIEENKDAWEFMLKQAKRLSSSGYVSVRYLINMVRGELHVSVRNGLTPAFARIMKEENDWLERCVRTCRSKCDQYIGGDENGDEKQ